MQWSVALFFCLKNFLKNPFIIYFFMLGDFFDFKKIYHNVSSNNIKIVKNIINT